MLQTLLTQLVAPISRRIGTAVGGYLTSIDMHTDDVGIIMAAIPLLIGLAVDTVHSDLARRWKLK